MIDRKSESKYRSNTNLKSFSGLDLSIEEELKLNWSLTLHSIVIERYSHAHYVGTFRTLGQRLREKAKVK